MIFYIGLTVQDVGEEVLETQVERRLCTTTHQDEESTVHNLMGLTMQGVSRVRQHRHEHIQGAPRAIPTDINSGRACRRVESPRRDRGVGEESRTSIATSGAASVALTAPGDEYNDANLRVTTKGLIAGVAGKQVCLER